MSKDIDPVEESVSVDVVETNQDVNEEPTPEAEIKVEVKPEIVDVVETPKPVLPKYKIPNPVNIDDVRATLPEPAGPAVVTNGVTDEVFIDACVYKNELNRKSLSVHHLQRRLAELGYPEAKMDKDGYFGDLTKAAIRRFQAAQDFEGNGELTSETFLAIFRYDPNVTAYAG